MNNLVRQQRRQATLALHAWKRKMERVVTAQPEMRPEATSRRLRGLQYGLQVYHQGIENALRDLDRRENRITKSIRRVRNNTVAAEVDVYGGSPPDEVVNLLYKKLSEIRIEKQTMQTISCQFSAEDRRLNVDAAFVRSVARRKRETRSNMDEKETSVAGTPENMQLSQVEKAVDADVTRNTVSEGALRGVFEDGFAAKETTIGKVVITDSNCIDKTTKKAIPEDCQPKVKDRYNVEPMRQTVEAKTGSVTRREEEIMSSRQLSRTEPNAAKAPRGFSATMQPKGREPKGRERFAATWTQTRNTPETDSQKIKKVEEIIPKRQISRVDSSERKLSKLRTKRILEEPRVRRVKLYTALSERTSYALAYACGVGLLGLATLLPTTFWSPSSNHQLRSHPEQPRVVSPFAVSAQRHSKNEHVYVQNAMRHLFSFFLAVWLALTTVWSAVKQILLGRFDPSHGPDVLQRHLAYGRGMNCVLCRECDSFPEPSGETVFISHTKQDGAGAHHASELWDTLTRMKYAVFYDVRSVQAGDLWMELIEKKVASSQVFVCLISNSFWFRTWCMHELDIAMRHNKTVVPVSVQGEPPDIDQEFCAKFRQVHHDQDPEQVKRWLDNIKNLKEKVNWIRISSDQDRDIRLKWATICAVKHHIHGQSPDRE